MASITPSFNKCNNYNQYIYYKFLLIILNYEITSFLNGGWGLRPIPNPQSPFL